MGSQERAGSTIGGYPILHRGNFRDVSSYGVFKIESDIGGEGLRLTAKHATTDCVWMSIHADAQNPQTRTGYLGVGNPGSTTIELVNDISGASLLLRTTGSGAVLINQDGTNRTVATISGAQSFTNKIFDSTSTTSAIFLNSTTGGAAFSIKKNAVFTGQQYFNFLNSSNTQIGWMGYGSAANDVLSIYNTLASIELNGTGAVPVTINGAQAAYAGVTLTGPSSFRGFSIRSTDTSAGWSWFAIGGTGDNAGGSWHIAHKFSVAEIGAANALHIRGNNGTETTMAFAQDHTVRFKTNTLYAGATTPTNGNLIWHAGNDGHGSGLDADVLDGLHSYDFVNRRYWAANITVNTWSTICSWGADGVLGTSFTLYIRWTRGGVVCSSTLLIQTNHSQQGSIIQIGASGYCAFTARLAVDSLGAGRLDILDQNTGSGLNTVHCTISDMDNLQTLSTYTTFTNGTDVTGYATKSLLTDISANIRSVNACFDTARASNFTDIGNYYNANLGNGGVEGRGMVAGFSGSSYGGIGFNVRHTATGGSWIAPSTDTSTYLLFNTGFTFMTASAGTAGRTLSYTTLGYLSTSSFLMNVPIVNNAGMYGSSSGAVPSCIWAVSATYSTYGIFYREGSPDYIDIKFNNIVTSSIDMESGVAYFNQAILGTNGRPDPLQLKATSADAVYMSFYARAAAQSTRSAFFGFGSAGTNDITLANEITGDIVLSCNTMAAGVKSTTRFESANGFITQSSASILTRGIFPGGAQYRTTTGTHTGAIRVSLPVGYTSDMIRITIRVYDYSVGGSFDVHVAGYNYQSTSTWMNTSAFIVCAPEYNRNLNIRFGYENSKCCIYIGETTTTWQYPQISVVDFQIGYDYEATGSSAYSYGWSIGFATSFPKVDTTFSNTQVGRVTSTADVSTNDATVASTAFVKNQTLRRSNLTLPTSGWVASTGTGDYVLKYTVTDAYVTAANNWVDVTVNVASLSVAETCGLCPTVDEISGGYVFYAKVAPASAISYRAHIFRNAEV